MYVRTSVREKFIPFFYRIYCVFREMAVYFRKKGMNGSQKGVSAMADTGKNSLPILLFECAENSSGESAGLSCSWQICDNEKHSSRVCSGPFQGRTLHELLQQYGPALAGSGCTGKNFPLEVKTLCVRRTTPLQVRGTLQSCAAIAGAVPGTELWYILSAEKGAKIMAGIRQDSSRMRFMESLASGDAQSQMQVFDSSAFDAYYIPGGRLHSIGEGNTILEIGSASASVFTLDNAASAPEEKAALQQALSCVDFMDRTVSRITGASDVVSRNRKFPIVKFCPVFHAEELLLVTDWHDNTSPGSSFHLLSAASGSFRVGKGESGDFETVSEGGSCLVPASYGAYTILPLPGESDQCRIIKTTLQ